MSFDLDTEPLPSHWFRRDPESGDWGWVPVVPAPPAPRPFSMPYALWDEYRASGFEGDAREWYSRREKVAA